MAGFGSAEILDQLDLAAKEFQFPMLDNGYFYPVDQRLHAFGDQQRWAVVIETLGYNPRAGNLINVLEKFGNCVGAPGADNDDFIGRLDNFEELWKLEQDDRPWTDAGRLVVRGITIPFPQDVPMDAQPWTLIRLVVPQNRFRFLASEVELRQRVPPDLPRMLLLDEWNHPDVVKGEAPSDSETFRMVAEALVSGDPRRYAPRLPPNTHWSNWPEGGAL
jgi:hypothetical protein